MINFNEQRILPYTPQQMYDLVLNIEEYPEFVTGCQGARIYQQSNNSMQAELNIGFGPLHEHYLSDVFFKPYEFVQASCHTKPFKHMINRWEFAPHEQGSIVTFNIDFEFQKSLFNMVTNQIFLSLSKDIMNSFISQASKKYK